MVLFNPDIICSIVSFSAVDLAEQASHGQLKPIRPLWLRNRLNRNTSITMFSTCGGHFCASMVLVASTENNHNILNNMPPNVISTFSHCSISLPHLLPGKWSEMLIR